MKILSVETSCDETAVAVLECEGTLEEPRYEILGNALYSQAALHAAYGGVFPNLAKREHAKNILPLLEEALRQAGMLHEKEPKELAAKQEVEKLLEREGELLKTFLPFIEKTDVPPIDAIAVTQGPGLEPALWVGVNFAQALGKAWNKPVIGTNHMEGHFVSVFYSSQSSSGDTVGELHLPALALLVSGGHTELVLSKHPLEYNVIGTTRDDAVGEAFDKAARLLGLPYPGGPEISKYAQEARDKGLQANFAFPRPMISTDNYDFSYSGLKTAVRYKLEEMGPLTPETVRIVAREFEDAALDVLLAKTEKALMEFSPKTLIVAGGVSANRELRRRIQELAKRHSDLALLLPEPSLATDNAVMIGMAGYLEFLKKKEGQGTQEPIKAIGNLSLSA